MDDTDVLDLPEAKQFDLEGHTVTILYKRGYTLMARICFQPALLRLVEAVIEKASHLVDPSVSSWNYYYVVVDEAGDELVSSPGGGGLRYLYDDYVKREQLEQNYDTLNAELIHLMEEVQALRERDLPVSEIEQALRVARGAVDNLFGHWNPSTYGQVKSALARVRRLIAELEGSFVSVVVRALMSKSLWRSATSYNESIRKQQLVLWIRLGGDGPLAEHLGETAIDLLTDDRLAQIYAERLMAAGVTNLTEVGKVDLTLDSEEFVPQWLLRVPELEPAPEEIAIVTSKRTVSVKLTYSLRDDGRELIPTGTGTIMLNDYKSIPKTGDKAQPRKIPVLPHGIELVLVLTVAGDEAVRGPVGELLEKRVNGYRGGRRRSAAVPPSDLIRTRAILGTVRWR